MAEEIDPIYGRITQPAIYEGASTSYKHGLYGLYYTNSGSEDTLAVREIEYLRMRAAHLIRNGGFGRIALDKYAIALGSITVNWKREDGSEHELMTSLWKEFTASPSTDGFGNFDTMQAVWNKSIFSTGAAYTRMLVKRKKKGTKVPLALQHLPTQLHNLYYFGDGVNDSIIHGMRFDLDKPVSYFFDKSIYQKNILDVNIKPMEIPAEEILHIFHRDSPGQWIGIPLLSSCIMNLLDLDDLIDATIAKQKAAQAIAWIIENTNVLAPTPVGSVVTSKDKNQNDKITFQAQGGNVQYLNKGEIIKFYQSTDIGANLPLLIKSELQRISSTLGIPYHAFTGDTDSLDFSTIRAVGIELRNRIMFIHHVYTIPVGFTPLTTYFKELASLYFDVEDAVPSYQLPRHFGADELKDTQADLLEVQSGFATLKSKLDERHTTFEEVVEDAKRNQELKQYGIDPYNKGKESAQTTNNGPNTNSTMG
jgi:lambda family phage portal protein